MTNSDMIHRELKRKCRGNHAHRRLEGSRASEACRYPEELCRAICRGLLGQEQGQRLGIRALLEVNHLHKLQGVGINGGHEEPDYTWATACDDVTGEELDPREVARARAKELGYIAQKKGVEKNEES